MTEKTIETICSSVLVAILFIGFFAFILINEKISNNHELKKLGIDTKTNKIINVTTDYNEKLKYYTKTCIIFIITIFVICILGKLFNFGIKDIADIFK